MPLVPPSGEVALQQAPDPACEHNGTMTSESGNVLLLFMWPGILNWAGDRCVLIIMITFGLDKKQKVLSGGGMVYEEKVDKIPALKDQQYRGPATNLQARPLVDRCL